MRSLPTAVATLLLCAGTAAAEPESDVSYFVLALSWSPAYCADNPGRDGAQCGAETPFAFIVHGLWPQFEGGRRAFCGGDRSRWVPRSLVESMGDLMPGSGLVGHQWRKHGTCSGLSQPAYFALVREAAGRVAIPPIFGRTDESRTLSAAEVEAAFGAVNASLDEDEMAVVCRGGRLQEVRICVDTQLRFVSCPEIDSNGCRSASIRVPEHR